MTKSQKSSLPDGCITVKEASKMIDVAHATIRNWIECNKIVTKKHGKRRLVNKESLLEYVQNHNVKTKIWGSIPANINEDWHCVRGYKLPLMISRDGKHVLNLNTKTGYKFIIIGGNNTPDGGYYAVGLSTKEIVYIHTLMLQSGFVPNPYHFSIAHHIDGNNKNNAAGNILPVSSALEHKQLHSLMKNDPTAYRKEIKRIKAEYKAADQKQKKIEMGNCAVILDPDFPQSDSCNVYLYLTKAAYKTYQKTGEIPIEGILMQWCGKTPIKPKEVYYNRN